MVHNNDLYNEDELTPPKWLNEEFLEKVLKNKEEDKHIKITKYVITPGTSKSDHYASIMFRAKVHYTVTTGSTDKLQRFQSMIIKTMPEAEGEKKDLLGPLYLFETEIKMYTETLPKFECILRKIDDETKLCAQVLYHELEPRKVIIFDDLAEHGFTTIANRFCNMEEVHEALTKLAKIHAISYKLGKEGDSSVTSYDKGMLSTLNIDDFPLARDGIKLFKKILAAHNDLQEYLPYVEKVENDILTQIVSYFKENTAGKRDGIQVLNHGDFHSKNMMIKNIGTRLDDLMLVDYQICFFGSAAIDLIYAFVMLFSPEMRRNHREEIIHFYVTKFQDTLKKIDYTGEVPTVADFNEELRRHKYWELFLTFSFIHFNYIFADPAGDLGRAVENEEYRLSILTSPAALKDIRTLLPRLVHRGYFNN